MYVCMSVCMHALLKVKVCRIFPCHTSVVRFKRIPVRDISVFPCILVRDRKCGPFEHVIVSVKVTKGVFSSLRVAQAHFTAARAVKLTNTARCADSRKGLGEGTPHHEEREPLLHCCCVSGGLA